MEDFSQSNRVEIIRVIFRYSLLFDEPLIADSVKPVT